MIKLQGFDHVAFAVRSLDKALLLYRDVFGGEFMIGGDEPGIGVRQIQLRLPPGTKIELLQPVRESSPIASFIKRYGEGVHHLTFLVDCLSDAVQELSSKGYGLVDTDLQSSARWKETYLRPNSAHGTIVQLAETPYRWDVPVTDFTLEDVLAGSIEWLDHRPHRRSDTGLSELASNLRVS